MIKLHVNIIVSCIRGSGCQVFFGWNPGYLLEFPQRALSPQHWQFLWLKVQFFKNIVLQLHAWSCFIIVTVFIQFWDFKHIYFNDKFISQLLAQYSLSNISCEFCFTSGVFLVFTLFGRISQILCWKWKEPLF